MTIFRYFVLVCELPKNKAKGSIELISRVVGTSLHPPTTTRNSTSSISQLLLTPFKPNFKDRFLGSTTT